MMIRDFNNTTLLDFHASTLAASAARCADLILKRRIDMDENRQALRPLFVAAGEIHCNPSHAIHHLLLLGHLTKARPDTVFAYEMCHDTDGSDGHGPAALQNWLAASLVSYADHANAILFHGLLRRNLPVRFTDAAITREDNLDAEDPSTVEAMNTCFSKAACNVWAESEAGLYVRNTHMLRLALELGEANDAGIIVQHCGTMHSALDRHSKDSRYTLAALCRKQDIPFVAMPVIAEPYAAVTAASFNLRPEEFAPVMGVPNVCAIYDPVRDTPCSSEHTDFQNRSEEAAYLNAVLKRVGLSRDVLSIKDYRHARTECKRVRNHAPMTV